MLLVRLTDNRTEKISDNEDVTVFKLHGQRRRKKKAEANEHSKLWGDMKQSNTRATGIPEQ